MKILNWTILSRRSVNCTHRKCLKNS